MDTHACGSEISSGRLILRIRFGRIRRDGGNSTKEKCANLLLQHADSYRHQAVPFLVDRILKLATTNVAVNLSFDGDFSLCVAAIATRFNVPLIVVLSLRDRFDASRSTRGSIWNRS